MVNCAPTRELIVYPAAAIAGRVKKVELHKSVILKLELKSAIVNCSPTNELME